MTFKDTIKAHLELKERNRWIEETLPLSRYRTEKSPVDGTAGADSRATPGDILDPDGPEGWPTAEGLGLEVPDALWSAEPVFDWGD